MTAMLRVAQTEDLLPGERSAVSEICAMAFAKPWEDAWNQVGPGLHVLAAADGRVVAHAMIIDRRVYLGHESDLALDVGYVEWVATCPDVQGEGHGSRVMREVGRIIGDEYVLGALGTGSNGFYERLGWETWQGGTMIRMADGQRVRSADEDGAVMVLRTPRTPRLELGGPIAVDWRAGEPW